MTQPLTCERCGALLPSQAAHAATPCVYCGAVSAPPARVIERVIERVVVVSPPAADSSTANTSAGPPCPRCARSLREGTSRATILRGCDQCYGVWLAREDVERLVRERDPDIIMDARRLVAGALAPRVDTRPRLTCIVCSQPLRRVEIPATILSLDVCDEHGTWFDWNDLPTFVHACEQWRAGSSDDLPEVPGLPKREQPHYDDAPDPAWVTHVFRPRALGV